MTDTYQIPQDGICVARLADDTRCTEPRRAGSIYCNRHHPPTPPLSSSSAPAVDPFREGLVLVVTTGSPEVSLLACRECGVLLWDVEAHWTDAHAHRLQALRARSS